MESEDVIEAIENAIHCIKEYKNSKTLKIIKLRSIAKKSSINEGIAKKSFEKIAIDDKSIINESKEFIKEAYMLGLSGQICPRCSGTGRI